MLELPIIYRNFLFSYCNFPFKKTAPDSCITTIISQSNRKLRLPLRLAIAAHFPGCLSILFFPFFLLLHYCLVCAGINYSGETAPIASASQQAYSTSTQPDEASASHCAVICHPHNARPDNGLFFYTPTWVSRTQRRGHVICTDAGSACVE